MHGKHHIVVESENLKYEFEIRRNITVIQGDSASGKTTLYHFPEQVYHEFYPIFSDKNLRIIPEKAILLLEDQAAGYQFYRSICKKQNVSAPREIRTFFINCWK